MELMKALLGWSLILGVGLFVNELAIAFVLTV